MLSNIFYVINFSFSILVCILILSASFTIIFLITKNRDLHAFDNILNCNTSIAAIIYSIIVFIDSIYGFHEEWALNIPSCSFRAYCRYVTMAVICYSIATRAISHLFFVVFYKRRYLLT